MRRKQVEGKPLKRRVTREPLAEGIVPLDGRGRRSWASMSDDGLVAFAQRFVDGNEVKNRKGLAKADSGLHWALKRKDESGKRLIDRIVFEIKRREVRNWASLSDEEAVAYARTFISERGITGRGELEDADPGLGFILRKRDLLDTIRLRKKIRYWASMSDDELVAFAQRFVDEDGVKSRGRLQEADLGLYTALRRKDGSGKRLIERVEFEKGQRDWALMSDEKLVAFAQEFVNRNGVMIRRELREAYSALYAALSRKDGSGKRLIERVVFDEGRRYWISMNDDDLVAFAQEFVNRNGVMSRGKLSKADKGLYAALSRKDSSGRRLIERVVFESRERETRDWASMSDDGLVAFAQEYVDDNGVKSRRGLQKIDRGLYVVLKRRGLLGTVLSEAEGSEEKDALREVMQALEEFP